MSDNRKIEALQLTDEVPELEAARARRTAKYLIDNFGSGAEAEARERLLLMYAIGSRQGVLNWLKINAELVELLQGKGEA